ncbi:MAG: GNAT family N-acetyltransferase [Bacillota bacterium]|nr:GNAT family N-acetyltransferase [Bacillota bacterium]
MKLVSKKFKELTAPELYEIMRARNEIFVIEQNCIYQDCDDCDYGYHVYYADEEGRVHAYMRIYEIAEEDAVVRFEGREIWSGNLTPEQLERAEYVCGGPCRVPSVQMGRVLTIKHGEGLGGRLLEEGIKVAWEKMGAERIFIEAESDVIGYYEKAGFKAVSGEFSKDRIPHIQMELYKSAGNPV